jgi:hypothetical protein
VVVVVVGEVEVVVVVVVPVPGHATPPPDLITSQLFASTTFPV